MSIQEVTAFIKENWYWIVFVAVPIFIRLGVAISKQTATPKDDAFFSKLQAGWNAVMKAVKDVINNPMGVK
jgi:hypothetical protein